MVILAESGLCLDCRYCRRDTSGEFSHTGYFCALSRCENITKSTRMDCVVGPMVTEEGVRELFALGLLTPAGEVYIRRQLLGKTMRFSEIARFLKRIPKEHPEYLIEQFEQCE